MPETTLTSAELYRPFEGEAAPVAGFIAWVAESFGLTGALRALDVGCGTGRLLEPLAAKGWDVVGLEPDAEYRAHAGSRTSVPNVEVRAGGFNDVANVTEDDEPYDLVLGINSSFSHVLTPEERAEALSQCRQALHWDGVILLDLPNLLRILFEYRGPGRFEGKQDGRTIQLERRHAVDFHAAVFTTHEVYTVEERDGRRWTFEKDHPYAITSFPELSYLLERAGFSDLRTYTSYASRSEERLDSGRMIIAAQAS